MDQLFHLKHHKRAKYQCQPTDVNVNMKALADNLDLNILFAVKADAKTKAGILCVEQ